MFLFRKKIWGHSFSPLVHFSYSLKSQLNACKLRFSWLIALFSIMGCLSPPLAYIVYSFISTWTHTPSHLGWFLCHPTLHAAPYIAYSIMHILLSVDPFIYAFCGLVRLLPSFCCPGPYTPFPSSTLFFQHGLIPTSIFFFLLVLVLLQYVSIDFYFILYFYLFYFNLFHFIYFLLWRVS